MVAVPPRRDSRRCGGGFDYYGDSVVNSVSDVVSMMCGFWMARRAPLWLSIAIVVVLEVGLAAINPGQSDPEYPDAASPFGVIKHWQLGG